jgi:hypothetical protein
VTWDPRGTVDTLTFSCYDNAEARITAAMSNQAGGTGNTSDSTIMGRNWVIETLKAKACYDRPESRERGSLIGNAFTARDAIQIVDALEEDKLLRFWGEQKHTSDATRTLRKLLTECRSIIWINFGRYYWCNVPGQN